MTAQPATDPQRSGRSECWCCGRTDDPDRLVHLGSHPEVTVCVACAHDLSKRASAIEDQARTGLTVGIRDRLRTIRATVIARGWHTKPVIGPLLRRIGKYTP